MADRSTALVALADPMRQQILERLADGPQSVGVLAADLPVSRPAVSQHLKILKEAGLVRDVAEGTRRIYRIDPSGIGAVREWLDRFWDVAMDEFKKYADSRATTEQR